ncbi:hypothetical protein AQUCO_00900994v1 [Aquilegia coerulea]|uniref:KIB1-4 beta-propeller domain-containing protein n=1 Tax=Aquilegia coerulea TaxID=218851 RepID=A0A2G5EGD3_AQUCA|nr:hypothetical protein AQUCO_00900994v1 [Aquilegia coerulea]
MELLSITGDFSGPNHHIAGFVVYKLSERDGNWNEVKSLGDQLVVFLGVKSICLRARDVPECQANSIYYTGRQRGFSTWRIEASNWCVSIISSF